MRFKWLNEYWQGTLLGLAGIIASLWLAMQGKLSLYIHPRYVWFTVVMSGIGLLMILLGFWKKSGAGIKITERLTALAWLGAVVCTAVCLGLLATKPSSLTSSTATQRGINTAALDLSVQAPTISAGATTDYSRFTVKEWASLLTQTGDETFFAHKRIDITGFVSAADTNPDVFYVSRFVVTCCAVDARPVGVPVYLPNWRTTYQPDQWLQVRGTFVSNPQRIDPPLVLNKPEVTPAAQPKDPYVH